MFLKSKIYFYAGIFIVERNLPGKIYCTWIILEPQRRRDAKL